MAVDKMAFLNLITSAKDSLAEAEQEVVRRREWLRGLEAEYEQFKARKVSEEVTDSRILLNG